MLPLRKAAGARIGLRGVLGLACFCVGLVAAGWRLRSRLAMPRAASVAPLRGFYFWKTQWLASSAPTATLRELGIGRLYLRLFDVDWDATLPAAQPVAPLSLAAPLPAGLDIVPVVFITNQVFLRTPAAEVPTLAERVLRKITASAAAQGITPREVQLDCDWSEATRARYFHFLALLQKTLHGRDLRHYVTSDLRNILAVFH